MASPKQPGALDVINRAKAALCRTIIQIRRRRGIAWPGNAVSTTTLDTLGVSYRARSERDRVAQVVRRLYVNRARSEKRKKKRREDGRDGEAEEQSVLELSRNFSFASELLSLAGPDNPYFSASHFIVARARDLRLLSARR